jgi:hypothetical protein
MTETAGTSGASATMEDQIVVSVRHVAVVTNALSDRGVSARVVDESRELGLTLLALPHDAVEFAAQDEQGQSGSTEPLGRLMYLLYRDFRESFSGWFPIMGKNRPVVPVTGAHTIGGGGACAPVSADLLLPPRAGDPGRGIRVGIADTALYGHPWLSGGYLAAPASQLTEDGGLPPYPVGHATFVAGLIMQKAPGATLDVRRVLDPNAQADSWSVAKELVRFGRSGIDVLNLSLGCFTDDNEAPLVLSTALDRLDPETVVVAAAGNQGTTRDGRRPMWPAAMDRVIAVGAVDAAGRRPEWSPDDELPWIDAVADGVEVTSTFLSGEVDLRSVDRSVEKFDGGARWSGTSFSSATVSGVIAANIVPGEVGATAAVAELLESAPVPGHRTPWIR